MFEGHVAGASAVAADHRSALLTFVRAVARWILTGRSDTPPPRPRVEGRFGGAFVSFYAGKLLRGCVGSFAAITDLAAALEDITGASLADPRFETSPVTLTELAELTIEVSLLSDPVRAENPLTLIPGRHGIVVRRGAQSGCFLPKVAEERGWSAEEFLSRCCTMKAGLPADAWRQSDTHVYVFHAEVFRESPPPLRPA